MVQETEYQGDLERNIFPAAQSDRSFLQLSQAQLQEAKT